WYLQPYLVEYQSGS
ncbi:hypothetical protein D043_1913B, partial [Vibrio parahaemolyticus EKP-021]